MIIEIKAKNRDLNVLNKIAIEITELLDEWDIEVYKIIMDNTCIQCNCKLPSNYDLNLCPNCEDDMHQACMDCAEQARLEDEE